MRKQKSPARCSEMPAPLISRVTCRRSSLHPYPDWPAVPATVASPRSASSLLIMGCWNSMMPSWLTLWMKISWPSVTCSVLAVPLPATTCNTSTKPKQRRGAPTPLWRIMMAAETWPAPQLTVTRQPSMVIISSVRTGNRKQAYRSNLLTRVAARDNRPPILTSVSARLCR